MNSREDIMQVIQIYDEFISVLDEVLVGQEDVKRAFVAGILCDPNTKLLLTGNTGMGKTTLASFLADNYKSEHISITSDMIPTDIQEQLKDKSDLEVLHIEEFNRASGKVQSTFIELLADRCMNIGGVKYDFNDFYTIVTQNNADIAGVFNVPQAVYDRFDLNINFGKLSEEDMRKLLFSGFEPNKNARFSKDDICFVNNVVRNFQTSIQDENIMIQVFNIIDGLRLDNKALFAGSNIRAHKFALKLAKLVALSHRRSYILPSDIAPYINNLYMHRINQNVARINDDNVNELFDAAYSDILSLKRER